jgi:hypothetical protein
MKVVGTAKIIGSLALVLELTEIINVPSCFSLSTHGKFTIPLKQDGAKLVVSLIIKLHVAIRVYKGLLFISDPCSH